MDSYFENWEVGTKYECKKLIGKGSYGKVAIAKEISTGRMVAIKYIDDVFYDTITGIRILREIQLLRKLKSEYTCELIDIIEPSD